MTHETLRHAPDLNDLPPHRPRRKSVGMFGPHSKRLQSRPVESFRFNVTMTSAPARTAAATTCRSFSSLTIAEMSTSEHFNQGVSEVIENRLCSLLSRLWCSALKFNRRLSRPSQQIQAILCETQQRIAEHRRNQHTRVSYNRKISVH